MVYVVNISLWMGLKLSLVLKQPRERGPKRIRENIQSSVASLITALHCTANRSTADERIQNNLGWILRENDLSKLLVVIHALYQLSGPAIKGYL